MAINSYELFEEFYRFCKEHSIERVVKEYGGGNIYIPSFKRMGRDKEILKRYQSGINLRDIAKEFELSITRVRDIIKSNT